MSSWCPGYNLEKQWEANTAKVGSRGELQVQSRAFLRFAVDHWSDRVSLCQLLLCALRGRRRGGQTSSACCGVCWRLGAACQCGAQLGIQFWEIGNENWGPWQAGYSVPGRGDISPKKYGEHCRAFIEEMKAADSSIKVGWLDIKNQKSNNPVQSRWNEEVLPEVAEVADYIIF